MEFKSDQICKSLIALLMAIALTIVGPGIAQAIPNTVRYTESGPPIQINSGLNFSGGLEYGDGELHHQRSNRTRLALGHFWHCRAILDWSQ